MFLKKEYCYHVSYSYKNGNDTGTGCTQITRKNKIKTFDDLDKLREDIEYNNGFDRVIIICYQRVK